MKKNLIPICFNLIIFLFIIICIIIFPEYAYESSLEGLNLWFNVVCPALLPFFICIEMLTGLGVINFLGAVFKPITSFLFNIPGEGAFAFVMSIASGYPVGAKVVANLRKENICNKIEAQRMISLCSTSGPLFIIGAVSVGMLKNPKMGPILSLSHYLSALSCGIIMRFYKSKEKTTRITSFDSPFIELLKHRKKDGRPLGQIMVDSIKNSINLILLVGGYIIFFSVIAKILQVTGVFNSVPRLINKFLDVKTTSSDNWSAFFIGVLEVTNGIKECTKLNMSFTNLVAFISFFIGFGGLSVNAQVSGIIQDTDINFPFYLLLKFFQGVIASLYSIILLKFIKYVPAFNYYLFNPTNYNLTWQNTMTLSISSLTKMLILLALLSFAIKIFNFYCKKN